MPVLQQWADHIFKNLYSTSRWTVPAHGSLFTGLYPSEASTTSNDRYLNSNIYTISEVFSGAGYETHCLSNNIHIDPFFGFTRGFESFKRGPALKDRPSDRDQEFDWDALFSKLDDGHTRYLQAIKEIVASDAPTVPTLKTGIEMARAPPVNQATNDLNWFLNAFESLADSPPEDLFLFANLMPPHYPYDPPEGYCDLDALDTDPLELTLRDEPVTDEEHERHFRNYEGAARYLDDELPQVIDAIDWDALFIVGDHGELFGEYGIRGHEYGMYEELVQVPALAYGNEIPEGETDAVASLLDVHRTLLDIAGIEPGDHVRGENLFELSEDDDRAVYAESVGCGQYDPDAQGTAAKVPASWGEEHYMLRTNDAMFIHDKDGERTIDPTDGSEIDDSGLRERAAELRDGLGNYGEEGSVEDEVPDEIEDRLEHLGYK
ncbi:sulfatase-like hydrolase/transferase [Halosimplex amylolyticum]|uniref:sulfatase-like hydrolase/transferase n=1 Tax=Halosimplex amylolyticum TaxID=3396616 RepID=UPI003F57C3CB